MSWIHANTYRTCMHVATHTLAHATYMLVYTPVLYIYTLEQMKKDHFTIITGSYFIENNWHYMHYHYKLLVTKGSKSVSKETFVEASKVIVKPSKVII